MLLVAKHKTGSSQSSLLNSLRSKGRTHASTIGDQPTTQSADKGNESSIGKKVTESLKATSVRRNADHSKPTAGADHKHYREKSRLAVKFSDVIPCLQWSTNKLPAGDAHRVWFPEMVARLRSVWDESMPFPELVRCCDDLNGMLQGIRHERQILPPLIRCRNCGRTGRAAQPRVSVRAVILAAVRFGVASPATAKRLEREWATYRVENALDLYGHTTETVPELRVDAGCSHTTASR
jgi:hypothetical protein